MIDYKKAYRIVETYRGELKLNHSGDQIWMTNTVDDETYIIDDVDPAEAGVIQRLLSAGSYQFTLDEFLSDNVEALEQIAYPTPEEIYYLPNQRRLHPHYSEIIWNVPNM